MKRRHYLAGTGVALVSSLAGCGGNDDELDSPTDETETEENGTTGSQAGDTDTDDDTGADDKNDTTGGSDDDQETETDPDEEQSGEGETQDDGDEDSEDTTEDDDTEDEQGNDGEDDDTDDGNGDNDEDTPIEYRITDSTGQVGEEITVTGTIDSVDGTTHTIGGYEAVLTYDPERLTFVSATSGPFQLAVNDQDGSINTVGTTPEGAETPISTAIELVFTAETAGDASVGFTTADSSVIDVTGADLDVQYHSGTVVVSE